MMRLNHTVEFAKKMALKYDFSNGNYRSIMTVKEAFDGLRTYVSLSLVFL